MRCVNMQAKVHLENRAVRCCASEARQRRAMLQVLCTWNIGARRARRPMLGCARAYCTAACRSGKKGCHIRPRNRFAPCEIERRVFWTRLWP